MRQLTWSGSCLLALTAVYLLCPFRLGIVCGSSMEPTYHSGQPILIDRAYYQQHPVERGDVILLRVGGETLIKRVFACAGDAFHVIISRDETGVSRFVVEENSVGRLRRLCRRLGGTRVTRVQVLPGFVYVLGDNQPVSVDSREFGMVPMDQVIGHVTGRGNRLSETRTAASSPSRILTLAACVRKPERDVQLTSAADGDTGPRPTALARSPGL